MSKAVRIDTEALISWMDERGMTKAELSYEIGRSKNCISMVIAKGCMSTTVYDFLVRHFDLPYDAFLLKEETAAAPKKDPTPGPKHNDYWLDLETYPDKLKLTLNFSSCGVDVEVAHAWCCVRGNTEHDLVQAISYAAHMLYKISEQNQFAKRWDREQALL